MGRNKNHRRRGFTMIEVVIVISIIGFLSTVGISSYRVFNQSKTLETETQKFVSSLELAKKQTVSGEKPCAGYSGTYVVDWTASSYTITPSGCSALFSNPLPVPISFLSTSSATFTAFGLGATESCIIVRERVSQKCRKVIIESSGVISEQQETDCTCP